MKPDDFNKPGMGGTTGGKPDQTKQGGFQKPQQQGGKTGQTNLPKDKDKF